MKKLVKELRVHPGEAVDLKRRPTLVKPVYQSKGEYQQFLEEHVAHLSALQELLYATNRHALLIIFQAMDAAGKDGCIKHVMTGVNPQGCDVFLTATRLRLSYDTISFGAPLAICRSAARSPFSTARITRKSSSFASTQRSCGRRRCLTMAKIKRSGKTGIAPFSDCHHFH